MRNIGKRKAQSTAEYAILIGIVVAVAVAMQTYVKRGLQARVYDSSNYFYDGITSRASRDWSAITNGSGLTPANYVRTTKQYEPTELSSQSTQKVVTDEVKTDMAIGGGLTRDVTRTTEQASGDYQKYDYNY